MTYGLLGEHLPHSFSKEIHERIADYQYSLIELSRDELDTFLTKKAFNAVNVTIPYKEAVLPYLDEIDDSAKTIGAVNTIVNKDGRLFGYNTDFGGMRALIRHMNASLQGKKVLILGTGGTSKTALAAARSLNAKEVFRVSRTGRENSLTYEEVYEHHTDAEVIINTTPCGMYPKIFDMPIRLGEFQNPETVIDAVYNPLSSMLVATARERGVNASGGLFMLVAQAVLAAEHFMNKKLDTEKITREIYDEIYFSKKNIVFIGMPGSGKSTVGKAVAARLHREFIDTDERIVEQAGAITEIFRSHGEKTFRDIETDVIRSLSGVTGKVISTGGGAILRQENVRAMRLNGTLFFLDRPLEDLIPTDDRPLADEKEKIISLYRNRYPLYRAAADTIVSNNASLETVTQRVIASEKILTEK